MRFLTVREPRQARYRNVWIFGAAVQFLQFEYRLTSDPSTETVRVEFGPDFGKWCPREFWPDIDAGVKHGCANAREAGRRLCSTRLELLSGESSTVRSNSHRVRVCTEYCISEDVAGAAVSIEPLHFAWLTADVIALAKGIHADAATDRFPVLSDALRDAGCEDALIHDHLQLCPDHGASCWVVEMILDQTRTAGA